MYTANPKEKESIEGTTKKYAESYAIGNTESLGFPGSGMNANLVSDLFKDKLTEQNELVGQLLYLIDERQRLFKRNINELENAISITHSLGFPVQTPLSYDAPSSDRWKSRVSLEKTITDIESKKSAEYVRCWQDIAQLKKDLWPVMAEYLRTKKKLEMLAGKESQNEIFNPYLKESEYRKETKIYVLPARIP